MSSSIKTKTAEASEIRLLSLDAYRGLIMVALAFNGFGLARTASARLEKLPDSQLWQTIKYQFSHVEWVGCAFWDMIQPSFMFMVGVSMAYSYVKRQARGDAWSQMFLHALTRSVILILLGVFLSSTGSETRTTNWAFMNVLTQIGLGYTFLFLMWRRPVTVQAVGVGLLLGVTWYAYTSFKTEGVDLQSGNEAVGIKAEWAQKELSGIDPVWHKNANFGHAVDVKLLNWFPRDLDKPFEFNSGGYQTFNFIPSLATMLIGLICGELIRSGSSDSRKLVILTVIGLSGVLLGLAMQQAGYPMVKRIWTPTWALFSTGICCLVLAALYAVIDVAGWRSWSYFLVVVGMNSLAIYMMGQLLRGWTSGRLQVHIGQPILDYIGPAKIAKIHEKFPSLDDFTPMLNDISVGLVFWLVCFWMAKQRIFIRV